MEVGFAEVKKKFAEREVVVQIEVAVEEVRSPLMTSCVDRLG